MKAPYRSIAPFYDLLYSYKDYERECEELRGLISRYKRSNGKALLDVACGTGSHLEYFENWFSCTGIDRSGEMLAIARKKLSRAQLRKGDMACFRLGRKFDIITCMFSAIGYARTVSILEKAIANISSHLKRGGVVFIEPWHAPEDFKAGMPFMLNYDSPDIKVSRLNVSKVRSNISVLDMHHLVAEKGKDVKYVFERHELGLFKFSTITAIMEDAGLDVRLVKSHVFSRAMFIGVK
ncbi:class I SAM-dependent methyltransferase [Candidatus Woesearchaeota archaeon]|nr:class I SAM-dependent methyltransferase [Candidatus Woesearchaeota archaeon]